MSIRTLLASLPLLLASTFSQAADPPSITQLQWLSGCWQLQGAPSGSGEQWSSLAGGTLLGSSRTLRDGQTVGFEFMQLRQHDNGRLIFTALPNGRDATDFIATRVDADNAVFENRDNDFPQRIHYRRVDAQHLLARIDIARDEPGRAIDFPMQRVACADGATAGTARTLDGVLQGAPWRLDVPAAWNGELVMLAHGYEPKGVPRPTPMPANDATAALTGAGFAVAQSAYASQGWAVADAIADTERLRRQVLAQLPGLRHTWLLGFSMGGAVTLATLERTPQGYDGGVALCGANLPGEVLANDLLTTLVAFDYFFGQAEGLPRGGLLAAETAALPQATLYQGIATALQGDADAAALLATRLQVQPDALAGTISLHALVLHELIERAGGMPVGNVAVRYSGFGDDAAFNAGVARVRAAPAAQRYVRGPLALTGALQRPVALQFNVGDPTIVPRMQAVYPQLATRAGATARLRQLPAAGEGHCGFSDAQVLQALQTVRAVVVPAALHGEGAALR